MVLTLRHSILTAPPPPVTVSWPKLSTTGPTGTLTAWTGGSSFNTPGQTITSRIITGPINVNANDVTFDNCRFTGFSGAVIYCIFIEDVLRFTMRNCEVDARNTTRTSGIFSRYSGSNANHLITGCDVYGCVIGMQIGSGVTVSGCYVHDLSDTSTNPDDRHFDAITFFSGDTAVFVGNALVTPPGTTNLFIKTEFGPIDNIMVRDNLFFGQPGTLGPSYSVYFEEAHGYQITNVTFRDNYVERGKDGTGYYNIVDCDPVMINNVEWDQGVDPTPAPVSAWLAAT